MTSNPSSRHHSIDYIEIPVQDMESSKEFYSKAFDWSFVDYGPGYAGIQVHGKEVGGLSASADVRAGGLLVILYSDQLEASKELVIGAGGSISTDIFSFPGGRRFHFLDPSGNELAVWEEC